MVELQLWERERERERWSGGSGEQCQVSEWQNWHLFANHWSPFKSSSVLDLRCEMHGRAAGGSCGRDTQAAIDPFKVHYRVLAVTEWFS